MPAKSVAIAILLLGTSIAQDAGLQFEVASVRPSDPGNRRRGIARGGPGTNDPEHLTFERAPFRELLMQAFGVQRDQLKGPDWAIADIPNGGALFDISAKVPPGTTKAQAAVMVQNLLKERFQLAFHRETVEVSGYALVVAKDGPKLKPSAGPVDPSERNPIGAGRVDLQTQRDGFPELFPGSNMGGKFENGTVRLRFRDFGIPALLQQISFALNARMVDRTGLDGKYDFTLEFAPTAFIVGVTATLPLAANQDAPLQSGGQTEAQRDSVSEVSSAMEKQLGLKLEGSRITVEMLVVDRAEQTPSEN